ncbi:aminoglycoside 6'-N-acetyltransferase [Streptococcus pneumoniae]|nr:aminoglycoside 6'-N-acetyltransferase [Streptococcus pneumoniae]CEX58296.1 aminoglycoside 6'-N-acetyltransferase [Streptococcus pneumoniae]CEX80677.1 aminoglycoside 6'-N-acetyltransferase [Streptococcus pneumoniae]CEY00995.1 aminoglycoside 6'-N-acetyltransferase [Streptococcus pneumoniae]CEY45531.1 aminoglycoside 6'-N-acetyltransferase [Streptococcus pneumoniae]
MDGITKDFIKTAKLMKQLWPQLTDKEAIDEVKKYTNGKNTAIFTEVEGDTIVGLALFQNGFTISNSALIMKNSKIRRIVR